MLSLFYNEFTYLINKQNLFRYDDNLLTAFTKYRFLIKEKKKIFFVVPLFSKKEKKNKNKWFLTMVGTHSS